jgi:hypothetical protein
MDGKASFNMILIELSNITDWFFCKARCAAIGKSKDGYYILSGDFRHVITFVKWDQPEVQLTKAA